MLRQIGSLSEQIVIVGGQAINFWVDQYSSRNAQLSQLIQMHGVFTSKDLDFVGSREDATRCAISLKGEVLVPTSDGCVVSPNTAKVLYHDHNGDQREIDFLGSCFGIDAERVKTWSLLIEILDEQTRAPTGLRFRVLHPLLCMESRARNILGLPGYDTPRARRQFHASVLCTYEFCREVLHQGGIRDALKLNKKIFKFCIGAREPGRAIFSRSGIDPFAAVVHEPPLPERFLAERYPQMEKEWIRVQRT